MKILVIRGRNLASLEDDFELDFTVEPLVSAGIFAISGPTGAGKSTLLDAMCLALFSRTPRTDQAKENSVKLKDVNEDFLIQGDPRFLLRRGTASGYAEVDFVALNGHRYRARWAVSRAREKESGRLQGVRLTLYNLDAEQEEQGSRTELQNRIVELIGLTFDQFTRSVLLAQNDFSTFLKAEQGEKASLLEKLTGTELYSEISRLIFLKNGEAKETYEKLRTQIEGITLLSETEEMAFQERLSETEKALAHLEKSKAERQTLQDAVKSVEGQIQAKDTQRKVASEQLIRASELFETARKAYEQGERELVKSEETFAGLRTGLQQARRLDVQLETEARLVSEAETQLREITARKREGEEKLLRLDARRKQGQDEWNRLNTWRERYRAKEPIAEQLSALLVHLDAAAMTRQTIERSDKTLVSLQETMKRLGGRMLSLKQVFEGNQKMLSDIEDTKKAVEAILQAVAPASIDQSMESCRHERERLLIEQAQFVTTGDIKALRDKLSASSPCPVCGSLEHPYATHEAQERLLALANGISECTFRLQEFTRKKEQYLSDQKRLSELQQKELSLRKVLASDESALIDAQNQQRSISEQMSREDIFKKEQQESLSRSFSAANALFGDDGWQDGWMRDPDGFRHTLTDFARQWRENGERIRQLERDQSAWTAEQESYESFLPSLREQYDKTAGAFTEKQASFSRLREERNRLLGGKAADTIEKEFQQRLDALKTDLKKARDTQVRQAASVEQFRGITEQIAKDLNEATQLLAVRRQELESWITAYDASSGGQTLEDALTVYTSRKSECSFSLRTHAENRRKVAGLQQEIEAKRAVSERWAKLNELAGSADGAKFRRIAQGYTLDVLLSYANVQLRELTRRYRLERVPDTLALQVIDQDMCDEIRTVHSLSGGESFLVSLALALGLSSLSSNRMKVESLFIDEGFGSLDAETLRMAMDALESLRTQGRKIGVISHVQEMTERIPVQIRVNRAGNGRSYIEVI